MQIELPVDGLSKYRSKAQRARVSTESWAGTNLYCPNCESPTLTAAPANTPARDYVCPGCASPFQLKAQSRAFRGRIVDAAYSAMVRAIQQDKTPNLFALQYDPLSWRVVNIVLIPHFAFPVSAIEKRRPLRSTARRAGWVGCNILLDAIPPDARIPIVKDGQALPPLSVRQQYARVRPLENVEPPTRGWTLDVLNAVRSIGKSEFSLADVYAREERLSGLHPGNRHIRDKIRQQLQVLRDLGLLLFLGAGRYRLSKY